MQRVDAGHKPVIILVHPQMGENIGAAARVMKNFGISELRIVTPRDGWPNEKARSMAAGAVDIVDKAVIYPNLAESLADLNYVYATTATPRDMNKEYILSTELAASYPKNAGKVGIMFGRENNGLSNEEITAANKIVSINTTAFSSLNLAQAIAVICYESFTNLSSKDYSNPQILATREEIGLLFEHLFSELDKKDFFRVAEKRPQMVQNIMNIFNRIDSLSKTEVQTLRGIINALTKNH